MDNCKTSNKIIKLNLKNSFSDDPSLFEIMAVDCFALQNKDKYKHYHALYITPKQCDGRLDAVMVVESYSGNIEAFKFEVSTGSKDSETILKFINASLPNTNSDKVRIETTNNILLTLDKSSSDETNIKIYSDDNLIDIISSIGLKYNLIDSKGNISTDYLNNLHVRSDYWQDYHNYYSKTVYRESYLQLINYLSICNLDKISHLDLNLITSIQLLRNMDLNTLLDANYNSQSEKFLAYQKYLCKKAPVQGVSEKDIEDILLFVGESLGFEGKDFIIKPTKRYLSIKSSTSNTSFCHIDWNIKNPNNKNAFIGIKGFYEDINHLDTRLKRMIRKPVLIKSKNGSNTKIDYRYQVIDSEVSNYLKYTMDIALLDINLSKDKNLFRTLLYKAKEKDKKSSHH
jgi:hypothetical protein